MSVDPLEQVLTLVAQGRLTADEAAPLLAALDAMPAGPQRSAHGGADASAGTPTDGGPGTGGRASGTSGGGASALRIEVRDAGRPVVNLRLPLAVGRYAADRIPGLSADAAERVREALRQGLRGPVLEVDEGNGDGVRIVLE